MTHHVYVRGFVAKIRKLQLLVRVSPDRTGRCSLCLMRDPNWLVQNGSLTLARSFDGFFPADGHLQSVLSKKLTDASLATERCPENCLDAFGSANFN